MKRTKSTEKSGTMIVSDTDIERAIRKRLRSLENLPVIVMPYDIEADDDGAVELMAANG